MRTIIFLILVFIYQVTFSQTDNPDKLYKEAYQYITNGNYNKSISLLTKAIALGSLGNCGTGINGKAQNELGYANMRIEKFELSRELFNKSIELNPRNLDPRINKVTSYLLEKDLEKAKIELDIFMKELPGYPLAYWQKGNILENEGKIKEAHLEYRKAIAFNRQLKILPESILKKINQKLKNN
jgi:tetratricopeptide (TPR) repeat protein